MAQILDTNDMLFHMLVVGGTGSGKTNAILYMLNLLFNKKEDAKPQPAQFLFDPGGDASIDLLRAIPKSEWNRVVILDPQYVTFGFNLLALPEGLTLEERPEVIHTQVDEFSVLLSDAFNTDATNAPRLMWIFKGALYCLYSFPRDPTLWELYNLMLLFTGKNPRDVEQLLKKRNIPDEIIRGTMEAISKLPQDAYMPVLNRISNFVLPPSSVTFRTFCNRKTTIDFEKRMEPGMLTIFRIPPDLPGEFRRIFASAVVMRLYFASLKRAKKLEKAGEPPSARSPVVFAADEFRDIAQLKILRTILSQSRKFGLYLWMVAQVTSDVPEELMGSVLANVGPILAFRGNPDDAKTLSKVLYPQKADAVEKLIPGLEDFSAVVRKRPIGGKPVEPPFRLAFPKLREPVQGYAEALDYMKGEMETRYGGAIGDRNLMYQKEIEQAKKDAGECYLGPPPNWMPLAYLHCNKGIEFGFSDLARIFEDTNGWERSVLRAGLSVLASSDRANERAGTTPLFMGFDPETKQPIYKEPETAEEKARAREVFYSITDAAEEEFFTLTPPAGKDDRAGKPLHLLMMKCRLEKHWAKGYYCAFDRGDRSDPFPDILVTETLTGYVKAKEGRRRATVDPEHWNNSKWPEQIEPNPAQDPTRVRGHYEYDLKEWGRARFVVPSPSQVVDIRRILQDKDRTTYQVVVENAGLPEDELERMIREEMEAREKQTETASEPVIEQKDDEEQQPEPTDHVQLKENELWLLAKIVLSGYPGRSALGSSIGTAERQVSRYLESLESKGLLEKQGNGYGATESGKRMVAMTGLTSASLPAGPDELRLVISDPEKGQG